MITVGPGTEEKPGGGGGEYGESNIEPGEILEHGVTSSELMGSIDRTANMVFKAIFAFTLR